MSLSTPLTSPDAAKIHWERFHARGAAFQAPGRVNLIGEHTDTSEGFVMPAALDLRTISVLSPRGDSLANIYSSNFDETISIDLRHLSGQARKHWSDYPVGVLWSLAGRGVPLAGFDMTLAGDVPLGSGLSSSASVEVAVAIAVLAQLGIAWQKPEIAKLCRFAENNFVGAQSGIMDPLASCCGVADHALLIDCRTLTCEPLPLPPEVLVVIANTMVKHSLSDGDGGYNQRRAEVEQGLKIVQRHHPEVRALRDVDQAMLAAAEGEMPHQVFLRCLHVVSEDARVMDAAEALRHHDFVRFGQLMIAAHASMRDNYGASCAEADTLVEIATRQPGCYGARITGGGFGGCTVNLVEAGQAEKFVESIRSEYRQATGIESEIYISRASAGAGPLG